MSQSSQLRSPFESAESAAMHRLSSRLAAGDYVPDGDVEDYLGDGAVRAFRYAQAALSGLARKTTGEPAFCHSADIALRARMLSYDTHTVGVCLLHDVVEEQSAHLVEVSHNLDAVAEAFGEATARDVRLLTNRYSVIINDACRQGLRREPFGQGFMARFGEQFEAYYQELSWELRREFGRELELLRGFLPAVDVPSGLARGQSDRRYPGASELRLQTYRLFVQEAIDDAAWRFGVVSDARGEPEAPLICKLLDLIDNLRTSPVVIRRSLERTLVKTELFLDCSFYLHGILHERGIPSSFVTAYDLLKYHLVQQLRQRRQALDNLSDTRFAFLAASLVAEVERLEVKYHVDREIGARIDELSDRIRGRLSAGSEGAQRGR